MIDSMSQGGWGMNTNLNAVFLGLILPLAVKHNVPKDQMIKRVFAFSDMRFDAANNEGSVSSFQVSVSPDAAAEWKTNHDVIAEAYAQAGYNIPELVYWDLFNPQDGYDITVLATGEREGVTLLSGCSQIFMDVEEEEEWEVLNKEGQPRSERLSLTPEELMKKALGRKSYDGLIVVD
ncbi:hypothetical protein J3R83DRAFT_1392 [Lanmaoa asiatica]|nr:hypothetical protein J3R83DRAFT_1392 [Lanmaoa asiatica]